MTDGRRRFYHVETASPERRAGATLPSRLRDAGSSHSTLFQSPVDLLWRLVHVHSLRNVVQHRDVSIPSTDFRRLGANTQGKEVIILLEA